MIAATQWFKNGDHPSDYADDQQGLEGGELRTFTGAERKANGWEGSVVRYFRHPDVSGESACKHCGVRMHEHGWIDTLEGGHIVCPGDFIITGVKGELYPCKPDIFAATYDLERAPQPVTEQELAAKAVAPRVTAPGLDAVIVAEYYFTAADGVHGADEVPLIDNHPLWLLTFCVLVLKNGFTITGQSACASPANFDPAIGQRLAYANAKAKIWDLEGYLLKQRLHEQAISDQARVDIAASQYEDRQ
ncbi:Gp49 family protein [Variovorax sp. LjRoot175]|uniref:Gp49 family protein n=1 Tax=Variovorax sp. LjRoot175 TaxID=3342276 RepID=UPI003F51635F